VFGVEVSAPSLISIFFCYSWSPFWWFFVVPFFLFAAAVAGSSLVAGTNF